MSQLDFTESGRRHTTPPHPESPGYPNGTRYAISAEEAKANNNKAKQKKHNKDNKDNTKDAL